MDEVEKKLTEEPVTTKFTEEQLAVLTSSPRPIEAEIKNDMIKAITLLFPGFGLIAQTVNKAAREGYNIILPLVFSVDGRVLCQEPIVMKPPAPAPVADDSGCGEQANG